MSKKKFKFSDDPKVMELQVLLLLVEWMQKEKPLPVYQGNTTAHNLDEHL